MKIESKYLVEEEDEVVGEIGIGYDSELYDVATLSFQKGKWKNGFVESTKHSNDYLFALLDEKKIEDLIQTLKAIKLAMQDDEEY